MEKVTAPITYFLYCRKSTDEGDGQVLSLDSQTDEAIKRFSDLNIIKLPPESVSAFEPEKRPVFADMIKRIEKGEAQGIIAWHPDRLSRNPIDAAEVIHLIDLNNQGKEKETWLEMSERTFNFARYASIWFEKGDEDVRRAIFACFGSSLSLTNRTLDITLRKPFSILFTRLSEANEEIGRLEPMKIPMDTVEFFAFVKQFPVMSG